MLDLTHIRDILDFQRTLAGLRPAYMSREAKRSCEELIKAIDQGRVQIAPVPRRCKTTPAEFINR